MATTTADFWIDPSCPWSAMAAWWGQVRVQARAGEPFEPKRTRDEELKFT